VCYASMRVAVTTIPLKLGVHWYALRNTHVSQHLP